MRWVPATQAATPWPTGYMWHSACGIHHPRPWARCIICPIGFRWNLFPAKGAVQREEAEVNDLRQLLEVQGRGPPANQGQRLRNSAGLAIPAAQCGARPPGKAGSWQTRSSMVATKLCLITNLHCVNEDQMKSCGALSWLGFRSVTRCQHSVARVLPQLELPLRFGGQDCPALHLAIFIMACKAVGAHSAEHAELQGTEHAVKFRRAPARRDRVWNTVDTTPYTCLTSLSLTKNATSPS